MFNKISTSLLCFGLILTVATANCAKRDITLIERTIPIENMRVVRPSITEYMTARSTFITEQRAKELGADIILTEREELANKKIMELKTKEIEDGFATPSTFIPSRHIFEVLNRINSSELFQIMQKLPKGAILHSHDVAIASTDYVLSLTYRSNLWQCQNTVTAVKQFLFSTNQPTAIAGCTWVLVADERARIGEELYNSQTRKLFTMYNEDPTNAFDNINAVWSHFMTIFAAVEPIITYAPVWRDYFKQTLTELYADNVQYLEFRGTLPPVYDLTGKLYTPVEIVQTYVEVLDEFKLENPGFIGAKFIYAPVRVFDDSFFAGYMETARALHTQFPDFVAGFDLVGQEDLGRPLLDVLDFILDMPETIRFFFHAGETNWFGQSTDENLIDAVLLGTERIGHGFALLKHPKVLEIVKERGIAIEVNPISNQVLQLVEDMRNHPASVFFADNYPVVISCDDPSFWETTPLSHDFYQAFLGIASSHQDLKLLKKLALNSLNYSAMKDAEKVIALEKWQVKWDEFIEELASGGNSA